MVAQNLILGIVYGLIGQILSYTQLQVGIRYGWNVKHQWALLLMSIPISWVFLRSVENLIKAFDGYGWGPRLIGFGLGVIVFSIMSWIVFNEGISLKTFVCILLSILIIMIQILWK